MAMIYRHHHSSSPSRVHRLAKIDRRMESFAWWEGERGVNQVCTNLNNASNWMWLLFYFLSLSLSLFLSLTFPFTPPYIYIILYIYFKRWNYICLYIYLYTHTHTHIKIYIYIYIYKTKKNVIFHWFFKKLSSKKSVHLTPLSVVLTE